MTTGCVSLVMHVGTHCVASTCPAFAGRATPCPLYHAQAACTPPPPRSASSSPVTALTLPANPNPCSLKVSLSSRTHCASWGIDFSRYACTLAHSLRVHVEVHVAVAVHLKLVPVIRTLHAATSALAPHPAREERQLLQLLVVEKVVHRPDFPDAECIVVKVGDIGVDLAFAQRHLACQRSPKPVAEVGVCGFIYPRHFAVHRVHHHF
mmetsp:Transcript_47035/g.110820  ORF Transcript_47035/g.110820 Transcript_47035/m.110820 type:complete len:208 (+) Transcript_47035:1125-1748(+)